MNNTIKYIICAGASLALGFGAGYLFKSEQGKIASQSNAAQFEADSIRYSSESFRQISSDIYSAAKSADEIHTSLENINKGIQGLGRGYTGSPGLPEDPGFGNLFPGPGRKDEPGANRAGGLDDLVKDKKEEEKK